MRNTANVALTILLAVAASSAQSQERGHGAQKSVPVSQGDRHAITQIYNDHQRDRIRSAGKGAFAPDPYIALLEQAFNGTLTETQGSTGRAVACSCPEVHRIRRSYAGETEQGHTGLPRRYLPRATDTMGSQVWVRTTVYSPRLRETVVRDIFGRPLHRRVEEGPYNSGRFLIP